MFARRSGKARTGEEAVGVAGNFTLVNEHSETVRNAA